MFLAINLNFNMDDKMLDDEFLGDTAGLLRVGDGF